MALEDSVAETCLRLERLHDALTALRLAIVEDKPLDGAGALLDRLGEAAFDLEGRSGEALGWLHQGRRATQYPLDLDGARQTLVACQKEVHRLQRDFTSEIGSCRRIVEIAGLERERGGEWASWARSVRSAIEQYHDLNHDLNEALFDCWREMAERWTSTVPVSTTGLAPKPSAKPKRMETHGKQRT